MLLSITSPIYFSIILSILFFVNVKKNLHFLSNCFKVSHNHHSKFSNNSFQYISREKLHLMKTLDTYYFLGLWILMYHFIVWQFDIHEYSLIDHIIFHMREQKQHIKTKKLIQSTFNKYVSKVRKFSKDEYCLTNVSSKSIHNASIKVSTSQTVRLRNMFSMKIVFVQLHAMPTQTN